MTARPEDILVAYDPGTVGVGTQASLLEVRSSFPEMRGGADTYYEDFTSGLRGFVESRRAALDVDGGVADVLSPDWLASPPSSCPCGSPAPRVRFREEPRARPGDLSRLFVRKGAAVADPPAAVGSDITRLFARKAAPGADIARLYAKKP